MTPDPLKTSTGLSSPLASVLAYSGWWVTGTIFWWLERRDRSVRRHAAQSVVAFGGIALLITLFALLTVASLSFLPSMSGFFAIAAAVTWAGGVVLWGTAMWKAARGDEWRMPVAGEWAERLMRLQFRE